MMKILIVCVNYNSYNELRLYLNSIIASARRANQVSVHVIVADNSTCCQNVEISDSKVKIQTITYNNIGYLGAAQIAIYSIKDLDTFDYVAISNVDLLVKEDFFEQLSTIVVDKKTAWIAPQIWSDYEDRDRNPKIIKRYSKKKLQILNLLYQYPILDWMYTNTFYKKKSKYRTYREQKIYAGHGSFILLTNEFFKCCHINYPIFLFGEELYLAELIMRAGLRVHYYPKLVVYDMEHVSTGKMKKIFYYKCNKESIDYILKTFYNE